MQKNQNMERRQPFLRSAEDNTAFLRSARDHVPNRDGTTNSTQKVLKVSGTLCQKK